MRNRSLMRKCLATALISAIAIGPASALDVGLGGNVGGLGVGAGVSAGRQGVSVGVGAGVDGVGGANVGASVGTATPGASVDAGASVGSTSTSTSAGTSTGTGDTSAAAPGGTAAASPSVDKAAVVSASNAAPAIGLPPALMPVRTNGGHSSGRLTEGYPFGPLTSLKARPGTPPAVVSACRAAIKSAAARLGARRVNVVSAGPMRPYQAGLLAPIYVRIEYSRQVREAKVTCRLDAARRVTAVI